MQTDAIHPPAHPLKHKPEQAAEELECRLLGHIEQQQPRHKRHALAVPRLQPVAMAVAAAVAGRGSAGNSRPVQLSRDMPAMSHVGWSKSLSCMGIAVLSLLLLQDAGTCPGH